MAQSVKELTERMIAVDLWSESTNEDRCDNCKTSCPASWGVSA